MSWWLYIVWIILLGYNRLDLGKVRQYMPIFSNDRQSETLSVILYITLVYWFVSKLDWVARQQSLVIDWSVCHLTQTGIKERWTVHYYRLNTKNRLVRHLFSSADLLIHRKYLLDRYWSFLHNTTQMRSHHTNSRQGRAVNYLVLDRQQRLYHRRDYRLQEPIRISVSWINKKVKIMKIVFLTFLYDRLQIFSDLSSGVYMHHTVSFLFLQP